jgi:hypothetical protein
MGGAAYRERGADSALTDSFIGLSKTHTTNLAVSRRHRRGAAIKKAIEAVLADIELDLQSETAARSRARV